MVFTTGEARCGFDSRNGGLAHKAPGSHVTDTSTPHFVRRGALDNQ